MHVISRKNLIEKSSDYPDAAIPLDTWYRIAKKALWTNLSEVRAVYPHADPVGECVVFNVGGNKYRLIVHIDYAAPASGDQRAFGGRILIFDVLAHKEYETNRWKAKFCGC